MRLLALNMFWTLNLYWMRRWIRMRIRHFDFHQSDKSNVPPPWLSFLSWNYLMESARA
jgi:hypothetical protein